MKNLCICLLCLSFILSAGCQHEQSFEEVISTDRAELILDSNILMSDLEHLQCNDGGFTDFTNSVDNIYGMLDSTYNSLLILKQVNIELSGEQIKKIQKLLGELKIEYILDGSNVDDVYLSLLYLKVSEQVGFVIPKKNIDYIINYIASLQDTNGYYYRDKTESDEKKSQPFEDGIIDVALLRNQLDVTEIIELCGITEMNDSFSNYIKCMNDSLNDKIRSEDLITIISILSRINETKKVHDIIIKEDLIIKAQSKLLSDINGSVINASMVYDYKSISDYKEASNDESIYLSCYDKLWNNNGFSITSDIAEVNLKATAILLEIFNKKGIIIVNDKKMAIVSYINSLEKYDGSYSYFNKESDIFSSYFACQIIKLYQLPYNTEGIREYVNNYFVNDFDDKSSGPIPLYYLLLANLLEINLDFFEVQSFLLSQVEIAKSANYENNREIILLLLKTMKIYNYQLSDTQMLELYNSISEYKTNQADIVTIELLKKSFDYINLALINKPVSNETVMQLIDLYYKNYTELEDKIYITKWIVEVLNVYELHDVEIDKELYTKILPDLKKCVYNNAFSYSSVNYGSLSATYDVISILDSF